VILDRGSTVLGKITLTTGDKHPSLERGISSIDRKGGGRCKGKKMTGPYEKARRSDRTVVPWEQREEGARICKIKKNWREASGRSLEWREAKEGVTPFDWGR